MLKVGEAGERRADSGQHRDKSCSYADSQRPGAALSRETVAAVRQSDARSDRENQQSEATDEEHVKKIDTVFRKACDEPD